MNTPGENEQDMESQSIPCQCLSDTMLGDFKRVVKNIGDDIHDLTKLTFMCDVDRSGAKGDKLTALDVLWKQVQKGKFAQDNILPLEGLLKDIDRCDLVTKHVEPYKQKYEEHNVGRAIWRNTIKRTSSAQSLPVSNVSETLMNPSPPNTASLMTGASQRKAHTDPSAQRARMNKRERAKAQARTPGTCMPPRPCTTVPEEELSMFANVHHSRLPSLQLPVDSLNPMVPSFPTQTPTALQQAQQATQAEQYSLGDAHLSGTSTPVRSRRSPSCARPSSILSFGEEPQWQRGHLCHGSTTQDPRTSLSTPASGLWGENLIPDTMEELSFAHSELEDCEEYSWPHNLPSDNDSHYGASVKHPCFHCHNHSYPHNGEMACSNSIAMGYHVGKFSYAANPAHSSYSLPTLLHSRYCSQGLFKYGQQQCHMSTHYHNKQQGTCGNGSFNQAPRTHTQEHTYEISRKCLLNGIQRLGKPLKNRINFSLPVGCQKKKDPKVALRVLPCENKESRHVAIEGELVIPRACSRHKWLVEYCDCSVQLAVKVIDPSNHQVLGCNSAEFAIAHSEVNCDHRTHMKLAGVLKHEVFLYSDSVEKFHFHINTQLFEHQFRQDLTVPYECKECDDDFTEISVLSIPSQVADHQ